MDQIHHSIFTINQQSHSQQIILVCTKTLRFILLLCHICCDFFSLFSWVARNIVDRYVFAKICALVKNYSHQIEIITIKLVLIVFVMIFIFVPKGSSKNDVVFRGGGRGYEIETLVENTTNQPKSYCFLLCRQENRAGRGVINWLLTKFKTMSFLDDP